MRSILSGLAVALAVVVTPGVGALSNVEIGAGDEGCSGTLVGGGGELIVDGDGTNAYVCVLFGSTEEDGTAVDDCGNDRGVLVRTDGRVAGVCVRSTAV